MSKASAIIHVGGPLVTALLVAAVLQAATPIKPMDMVIEAIARIVLILMPLAIIGFAGIAVYAYAQTH